MVLDQIIDARTSVLVVAIIATLLSVIPFDIRDEYLNEDIISAASRAKSDGCKLEILNFALVHGHNRVPLLQRTCHLDDKNIPTNLRHGCVDRNQLAGKKIGHEATTVRCFERCFAYGNSYAGHDFDMSCYCGAHKIAYKLKPDCDIDTEIHWYRVDNGVFTTRMTASGNLRMAPSLPTQRVSARIAFLLSLNGRSEQQIRRLLKILYSPKHVYYIHIDARSQFLHKRLRELMSMDNIHFARTRYATVWGSPRLLDMLLDAFHYLAAYQWDYMINLSESDYPLKPLADLENFLASDPAQPVYLKSHNLDGTSFIKKQGLDRNFYQCENRVWLVGERRLPTGVMFTGGSDWFALPRDFCQYVSKHQFESEHLVASLRHMYNFTLLPAESFFQTVAVNSQFCDRYRDNNLRATNWSKKKACKCQHQDVVDWCGCSPLVHRFADKLKLEQLSKRDGLYFARKFDSTISATILDELEQIISGSENSTSDARYWLNIYDHEETDAQALELGRVLSQIGQFAIRQRHNLLESLMDHKTMHGVHAYFDANHLIGHVFVYCDKAECIEMLISKNDIRHTNVFCADMDGFRLHALEVNHGFDSNERLFRDFRPLNAQSMVGVYHEWKSRPQPTESDSPLEVEFVWTVAGNNREHVQIIKLKRSAKPQRLTFAHRLNMTRPLQSGLWQLSIRHKRQLCFSQQFLIFNQKSHANDRVYQEDFDRFYTLIDVCTRNQNHDSRFRPCKNFRWSQETQPQHRLSV